MADSGSTRVVKMSAAGVQGLAELPSAEVTALLQDAGVDVRQIALEVFDSVVTEENTDRLIDVVLGMAPLPWWTKFIPIRSTLDKLLPEALRKGLVALLY